ncbi:Uncharacterized conserved protein YutE, UPF0331/DUF86 family [Carboxydocella sporoproducens DSM 16521]|uniref:Uncharacterized conserved protein YutE, UPF0331/DUF86 family n=2 Tax=Carboxydocella TaxID=178898 RepID=A0A1T4PLM1_9FIRM|nr:Uncharacterized conserved protein YutE, UPF0331/DUF86 family [Carboxydocella thermautotrophica]AVX29893.1 Uncharacterized conserved protein YutE, UPF0331/DUF86 family [Carboxydocella thermautotrophica]SJZ92465.1 Uncharacterized conserved protein YutE, UPF0331/DUF86 family [Carboxydocella sporoproducens DSM 16521]
MLGHWGEGKLDEKLLTQTRLLKKYINLLEKVAHTEKNVFLKDEILTAAAERYLQLAIETCINIGNRIIALEQIDRNLPPPETYVEIFETMFKIGLINEQQLNNYRKMARFRNKLVHVYWEIDHETVYEIITNNLSDLKEFLNIVVSYLQKN